MRARIESVSPDKARKWLEASEGVVQRTIRPRRVAQLEHAIRAGQWRTTHQGIALTEGGAVLDGQHRLHAIIAADDSVEVLVSRGVDPEDFGVIDTGASRTPSDSLKIAGHTNVNVLAAVARIMLVYPEVAGTVGRDWSTRSKLVTSADILNYLDDPETLDIAHAAIAAGARVANAVARMGATTPISAALMFVMTSETDVTPTIRAEFVERLVDGVLLGPRSPILAMRRWLVSDTGYVQFNHTDRRIVTVANTVKALNEYALGTERSLTIFRFGREVFPAPIPPGAIKAAMKEREESLALEEANA
jgi:hypothetical protein